MHDAARTAGVHLGHPEGRQQVCTAVPAAVLPDRENGWEGGKACCCCRPRHIRMWQAHAGVTAQGPLPTSCGVTECCRNLPIICPQPHLYIAHTRHTVAAILQSTCLLMRAQLVCQCGQVGLRNVKAPVHAPASGRDAMPAVLAGPRGESLAATWASGHHRSAHRSMWGYWPLPRTLTPL